MARGRSLLSVLEDLRVVIGASLSPGHNTSVRESHVLALRKTQEWLWSDFNWPHLRVERELALRVGQRYYSMPSDVAVDRIERLDLYVDSAWYPIEPEIENHHYSAFNSDTGEQSWPPRRWRIAEGRENDGEQIEIWPIPQQAVDPVTRDGWVKITGIRNLKPFRDDSDRLDLDDQLVVLYTAPHFLSDVKKAQLVQSQAVRRDARLRGEMSPRRRFSMFSTGRPRVTWGRPVAVYTKPLGT